MTRPEARQSVAVDARDFAVRAISDVVRRRLPLDDVLDRFSKDPVFEALAPADRGLARAIAVATIRGLGYLQHCLDERLKDGLPPQSGPLQPLLLAGLAQLLFLDVPDYAAVDTTVAKLRADRIGQRYAGLANAVLRGVARDKAALLARLDPLTHNTPEWLAARWRRHYGEDVARSIAAAHLVPPPIDLTVRADAITWAERLGGVRLPTGSLRLNSGQRVPDLPGFSEGAWWVQDAVAALPARLLRVEPGQRVLDLCAAPGGKTAQLAAMGARVVAVDRSPQRLKRLEANLARLGLAAEVHAADGGAFSQGGFQRILLDAPCSATGTIRRHPDVAWNKTLADLAALIAVQRRLVDHAWTLLEPGGVLVYATCSLEPEEGEEQIARFLADHSDAELDPIGAAEAGDCAEMITAGGLMRALPCHLGTFGGCDGFFSARLRKQRP
ncbi:MAG TPA: 16S rRNA (cytosine(967)-C(5))-methyltransferase RsmB [Beijerinckiaceae bacterium]|mgnify:CR=1 FL=1|nr:16S rRNA (cytosine(967)-C(5))-methyltransferase RsmB [Beijerinckiaceae bacterium]